MRTKDELSDAVTLTDSAILLIFSGTLYVLIDALLDNKYTRGNLMGEFKKNCLRAIRDDIY